MIKTPRQRELELLLRLAQSHRTCAAEQARIEGDELVIPFDCLNEKRSRAWTIEYERVRNRRELLDALGY
jgi:hypothetical protein